MSFSRFHLWYCVLDWGELPGLKVIRKSWKENESQSHGGRVAQLQGDTRGMSLSREPGGLDKPKVVCSDLSGLYNHGCLHFPLSGKMDLLLWYYRVTNLFLNRWNKVLAGPRCLHFPGKWVSMDQIFPHISSIILSQVLTQSWECNSEISLALVLGKCWESLGLCICTGYWESSDCNHGTLKRNLSIALNLHLRPSPVHLEISGNSPIGFSWEQNQAFGCETMWILVKSKISINHAALFEVSP